LGKLGKGRPEVLVHLQSLLADPYMWARRKACEALGELGDTDALEALEALIRGEAERRVEREAEKAIAKINRRHASPALVSP
jgi:HEAT repeat protein